MLKYFIILSYLGLIFQPLNAKVKAPNYEFKYETFLDFYPGKAIEAVKKKYGTTDDDRFIVKSKQYQFTVLTQNKDGVIFDFFARLPSYFLHDVFFQSLVNRLGKQDIYHKVGEEAFYVWNKNDFKHVYSAACTITCFPIFYTVMPIQKNGQTPQIDKMNLLRK